MTYSDTINALSDPTRRSIYERLCNAPMHAAALVAELSLSQPAISQHLKILRNTGLIFETREGLKHIYSATPGALNELQHYLEGLSQTGSTSTASIPLRLDDVAIAAQQWEREWPGENANVYAITVRLLQLGRHIERFLKETAERHDLQGSELLMLDALALTPEYTLTPSQLQTRLGITKSGITKLMDRLESLGLISRIASASDRRMSHVSLTQKAHDTLETILNHHEYGADHAAAKRMPADQIAQLASLLQIFHGLLDDEVAARTTASKISAQRS